MNLFLYSNADEFLTQLLVERLEARKNWRCLSTSDLKRRLSLRERLTQDSLESNWSLDNGIVLKRNLILDRVFSFRECHDDDFESMEMDSLLFYLRKSSTRHLCTLMHNDPLEWCSPLVNQWENLRGHFPDLAVPNYEMPYLPKDSALPTERTVIVAYGNRLQWRPGRHFHEEGALAFERPRGNPISILATPNGVADHPNTQAGELARQICAHWGIWFAEIIFFEDGDKLTFGMVNVQPSKALPNNALSEFIDQQLKVIDV